MALVTVNNVYETFLQNAELADVTLAASGDTYVCRKIKKAGGVLVLKNGSTATGDLIACTVGTGASTNVITINAANTTNPRVWLLIFEAA